MNFACVRALCPVLISARLLLCVSFICLSAMHVESWIVRPPPSVTTVSKVDSDKTVSCLVAEDGMEPPNPWYDQDGGPVKNVNGIAVTPSSLPGIGTVHIVEWKLTFTNPLEHVIPNTGVNYTCKGSHSNATATLKWASK